jgi:hypothetical protein
MRLARHIAAYLRSMQPNEGGSYEIRIKGHLNARWAVWFDGLSLRHEADGTTTIHGPIVDQAALHGLLTRVRDTGLPLLSVTRRKEQEQ